MTYESDNPQFDHLMNNMDSDEIPYRRSKVHTHAVKHWDGHWNICKCGARRAPGYDQEWKE